MRVKIFMARRRVELEEQINKWLVENPVSPESMIVKYSTEMIDDSDTYIVEHTIVLFYVPFHKV